MVNFRNGKVQNKQTTLPSLFNWENDFCVTRDSQMEKFKFELIINSVDHHL